MPTPTTTTPLARIMVNSWSDAVQGWRQFFPSLAPYWLNQRILSSWISGGHFSLLATTVNQQATGAPEMEEQIVTRVASYGKQLGRLVEAVDVLAKHVNGDPIDADGRLALEEFKKLACEISTARERFAADRLDGILRSIIQLGRPGKVDHQSLRTIRDLVDNLDRET
ncbi:MAG TPA: hypothetical protein VIU11_09090 [Nakamurella sp.]